MTVGGSRYGAFLPAHEDQGTGCNGHDSHESAQSRKTEIEQGYESSDDEPDSQQQHSEVLGHFHCETPVRVKSGTPQ
jgi:hypothetical protein